MYKSVQDYSKLHSVELRSAEPHSNSNPYSRNTVFWLKNVVKKGYFRNESLSLAWDCVKVCQVALFITTRFSFNAVSEDMMKKVVKELPNGKAAAGEIPLRILREVSSVLVNLQVVQMRHSRQVFCCFKVIERSANLQLIRSNIQK